MTTLYKYKVRCTTENAWVETAYIPEEDGAPTSCPHDQTHAIDQSKTKIIDTIIQSTKKTTDNRQVISVMRFRDGFTVVPRGRGDDIVNGTVAAGPKIKLNGTDAASKTAEFQILRHWYAIGGRAIWEGCDMDDEVNVMLIAPAVTHEVANAGMGAFNKVEVIPMSGLYMFVPAPLNDGGFDLDLTAMKPNTTILKTTLVPAKDALTGAQNGFFDFDPITNVITVNETQTGEFNAFSFDTNLFSLGYSLFGRKGDGIESKYETTDVEAKILYNFWKLKFQMETAKGATAKVAIEMIVAQDKNT